MKDAEIEAEIEDFLEGLQSADLSRHADQWGPRGNLVKPERHERAVEATMSVQSDIGGPNNNAMLQTLAMHPMTTGTIRT